MGAARASDSPVARAMTDDGLPVPELLATFRAGPALVREAIAGMTAEQLRARPIAGKLSTLDVVCHLGDADQMICDRMKRTIATELPLLVGVENIGYVEPLHYAERDLELQLQLIELTRMQMAEDLDRLSPDAWERGGIHTEIGLVTLRQQLLHAIHHVEGHLSAVAEKRAALGIR
jgi:hypothetical protein